MSKSKYDTHVLPYLEKITQWAQAGATEKEIAEKLHIAYSTFRKYLDEGEKEDERYAALSAAFARACEEPDDQVEAALFRRACGIEYEEQTFERVMDKDAGIYREVCTKRVKKFIPPDPTSAMFWLANRRPERWEYKPEKRDGEEKGGGVVLLSPVMENPGQQDTEGGGTGG